MIRTTRRNFLKLGMASGALLAAGEVIGCGQESLTGTVSLEPGGKDFSPKTGAERTAIPTACWNCVTRCAAIGFVEDGRLVKMESNPDSIRTEGKMCAKGQAGPNHVYDPDRVLYPMKRVGPRGGGQWQRLSWDAALTEIVDHIKPLRDAGTPEKFMFHYGRMKASSSKLVKSSFLHTFGTETIGNHTSICEGGKWVAQELTWGKHYDSWDFDNTGFVLNFGSNVFEAHTNHIPTSPRLIRAMTDRGVRLITFDVKLSNTAAKSSEWIPIKPGTDGAVMLAMCNHIISNNLHDRDFLDYVKATGDPDASTEEKEDSLRNHLDRFTPEWAEGISGISADKIKAVAEDFATTKPACLITYRGAVAHYCGAENERSAMMLASLTGNIDNPGGRCKAVGASWEYPKSPDPPEKKGLKILNGFPGQVAFPNHHVSNQILKMIKDGSAGRPEVYMWYCHTPVFANGEVQENIDVLKDESMLPYSICINPFYDESAALADLILPDATYLERWDSEDMVSPTQVAEYYIRQPLVEPLCGIKSFADVCFDLADRMGMPLFESEGINSMEDFVRYACENTTGVPGFDYMKQNGVWHDPEAEPKYYSYKKDMGTDEDLIAGSYTLDPGGTGVWWKQPKEDARYGDDKHDYKTYKAQKLADGTNVSGFKPDKINKSGFMELYSELLAGKDYSALPSYYPIPEHQNMSAGQLVLTTYKVAVQTHSRNANCKWLSELFHENPGWIHPDTAASLGIGDGDTVSVTSSVGSFKTKARVTKGIIPGAIAVSHHLGHWQYGRYASGNPSPDPQPAECRPEAEQHWWNTYGVRPNWAIPNSPDPISGQQRWMDTVVTVTKI
ncbi:dimethyl sulfoxide reductase DmsA precursor [bacterium BMS3Abin01]|nr:dimethyl sulfoxide reductase DmsA precursor [bacterium BMS3Abin01]